MLIWSISNRDWEVQWFSDSSAAASRSEYSDCVANSRIWNSTAIMKLDDGWMHPSVTKEEKNWRIDLPTYLDVEECDYGCYQKKASVIASYFSHFLIYFLFSSLLHFVSALSRWGLNVQHCQLSCDGFSIVSESVRLFFKIY